MTNVSPNYVGQLSSNLRLKDLFDFKLAFPFRESILNLVLGDVINIFFL